MDGVEDLPDGSWRITDLGEPVRTDAQQAAVDYATTVELSFDVDNMLSAARDDSGLDDFGPDDFLERLGAWAAAVEADEGLNPLGRLIVHRNGVRALTNRLRLQRLLTQHPEIHDVEVHRPIIVLGLPRSGTTHLVNLIAADRRLRSLPYWESLEPIPIESEVAGSSGEDPRLVRCRETSAAQDQLAPLLRAMHHMTPEHVHEEVELQELDFGTYLLEWNAMVPSWRDHYLSLDLTSSYRYLRTVIQALQWLRGPDRWILKSPQHLEQIRPLLTAFPDAVIAMTHRDPVSVITSAITMLGYGDRVRRRTVDLDALSSYWIDRVERLLRACVRDRDLIPDAQAVDVLFHEFMTDDVAMVARIYERAGLGLDARTRHALDEYMQSHARGAKGRVAYDLEGDFGIKPDELRARFGFYFERFAIEAGV